MNCQPGEADCPSGGLSNVDCAGHWSACTSACEGAGSRTWTETAAQSGTGAACPAATNCQPGEADCPSGGPSNVDCAGSWSACTSACEGAGSRTWTETAAQSGTGAACPAATNCQPGEADCPSGGLSNVDCAGSWSACTSACEAAGSRTWTE